MKELGAWKLKTDKETNKQIQLNYIRANIREEMKCIEDEKIIMRNTFFTMYPKHWELESKT